MLTAQENMTVGKGSETKDEVLMSRAVPRDEGDGR